jgi:hypothetical protein
MNHSGEYESENMTTFLIFYISLLKSGILPIGSKQLSLGKVLLRELIFYIVYTSGSVINRQKFCIYGWGNLFQKSSVIKECGIVVSNSDRNKLAIDIFRKYKRAKK